MIDTFNGVIVVAAGEDMVLPFVLQHDDNTLPDMQRYFRPNDYTIDRTTEVILAIWIDKEKPLTYKGVLNTIREKWLFNIPAADTSNLWGRAFYQIFVGGKSLGYVQPIYFV